MFTRPWTMSMLLYRRAEPHFQLLDYECYAFFLDDDPIVVPTAKGVKAVRRSRRTPGMADAEPLGLLWTRRSAESDAAGLDETQRRASV